MNEGGSTPTFSAFLPLVIVELTVIVFLGWQLSIGARQYMQGRDIAGQQEIMLEQAAQIETNFQALMLDVIALAERNPDVSAIVENYNIRYTPPGGGSGSAVPMPMTTTSAPPVAAESLPRLSTP
jgi:hypothetical protein